MAVTTLPKLDRILSTHGASAFSRTFNLEKFETAVRALDEAHQAGQVFNAEYKAQVYWVKQAAEHAHHVAADNARVRGVRFDDARDDIGHAYELRQAAPLSRRLKKLASAHKTDAIQTYIETLDEIAGVWSWLQSFKPIIKKGRQPNPNAAPKDTTNIATCAICGHEQKMTDKAKLVHHGFQISDGAGRYFGHREGSCFGVGYLPLELSHEANDAYLIVLGDLLTRTTAYLNRLEGGEIHSLSYTGRVKNAFGKYADKLVTVTDTDEDLAQWTRHLRHVIDNTKAEIRSIESVITFHQHLIHRWTPKPAVLNGETIQAKGH